MASVVRTTQILGMTASFILSGIFANSTLIAIPPLYTLPTSTSTPVFAEIFHRGTLVVMPLVVLSTLCNAYLAYEIPMSRTAYSVAACATFGTLPWTLLLMKGGIDRLVAIAGSKEMQERVQGKEVEGLLRDWAAKNSVRGFLALVGGLAGLVALVDEVL